MERFCLEGFQAGFQWLQILGKRDSFRPAFEPFEPQRVDEFDQKKIESLIPLRNQRTTPDGEQLLTRITEGLTRYECDGMTGWGMSEYLDQIVDGIPIGAV